MKAKEMVKLETVAKTINHAEVLCVLNYGAVHKGVNSILAYMDRDIFLSLNIKGLMLKFDKKDNHEVEVKCGKMWLKATNGYYVAVMPQQS
jgi:hypothetical protein